MGKTCGSEVSMALCKMSHPTVHPSAHFIGRNQQDLGVVKIDHFGAIFALQ